MTDRTLVQRPPAGDEVRIWVYLALENRNGRFQGIGGHRHGSWGGSANFALNEDGTLNWQPIQYCGHTKNMYAANNDDFRRMRRGRIGDAPSLFGPLPWAAVEANTKPTPPMADCRRR